MKKRFLTIVGVLLLCFCTIFGITACGEDTAYVSVESITLDKTEISLKESKNAKLEATVLPETATFKQLTWESSDDEVAFVGTNGKILALSEGVAVITVKSLDGKKEAICSVIVTPMEDTHPDTDVPDADTPDTDTPDTDVPDTDTPDADVPDTDVPDADVPDADVPDTDTPDTDVSNEDKDKVAVTGIMLSQIELVVTAEKWGNTATLFTTIFPQNASNQRVLWESSDSTVATVENGFVTGVKPGTCTVTVTTEDGSKKDSCTVIVVERSYKAVMNNFQCRSMGYGGVILSSNPYVVQVQGLYACTHREGVAVLSLYGYDGSFVAAGIIVVCEHIDEDVNNLCDKCELTIQCATCVDNNNDYACDFCWGSGVSHTHVDADSNDICDTCKEQFCLVHIDEDHDQQCDKCSASVACEHLHADQSYDYDSVCDWCGSTLPMAMRHEHTDFDHNEECDFCLNYVPCDHVPEEAPYDGTCKYCGNLLPDSLLHIHTDLNNDDFCDLCEEEVDVNVHIHSDVNGDCICDDQTCLGQLPHVDEDCDCFCDVCETEDHPDEDSDWSCDYCAASTRDCETLGHIDDDLTDSTTICAACGAMFDMPILNVALSADSDSRSILEEMGAYYNENVSDGTHLLNLTVSGYVSAAAGTYLASGSQDVTEANDQHIKGYIWSKYLLDLNPYVASGHLDISGLYPNAINRLRVNVETGDTGADPTLPLWGVPTGLAPAVGAYNKTAMEDMGISIISIAEADLDAYNEENGTSYLPHGFYCYEEAPDTTATEETIMDDTGYFVFNDQIAMNWEELKQIGEYFTQDHNSASTTAYGYYSEWWFNYGWSVGGDCLENGADGKLKFTLADTNPNYLVTAEEYTGLESGNKYKAGELLNYVDRLAVEDETGLYVLPSQFDAFKQFCSLSMGTDQNVTNDGSKGFGISPNPTMIASSSRPNILSSEVACIVAMGLDEVSSLVAAAELTGIEFGICPLAQYREYNEDGTLKTVDGVPCVGVQATHDTQNTLVISSKTTKPYAAVAFVNWWASEEAQSMLIETGTTLANRASVNEKPSIQARLAELFGCENMAPVVGIAASSYNGDWGYVNDSTWINAWANKLHTDVRNGVTTLDDFWAMYEDITNAELATYTIKKYR